MATSITASQFRDPTYAGESFALFTALTWASLIQAQRGLWLENRLELLRGQPRLHTAFDRLPLGEADLAATGAEVAFFRRWVALAGLRGGDDQFDDYWNEISHDRRLPQVKAAVSMVGGWHDIFLPWQLADDRALREAGAAPYLTIGPWTHGSQGLIVESLRESVLWLGAHLRGQTNGLRDRPVRIFVEGAGAWREYDEWPPPNPPVAWHLHAGRHLAMAAPRASTPDRFTYDPADPTPSVGGPLLVANLAGPRDNSQIEARPDVLVYSSDRLTSDVEIVGPVRARVFVRASRPFHDVFVRLCDVTPGGQSRNVCDGLTRVVPKRFPADVDGVAVVEVELWPAAYRFATGHRLRVQVTAGAHPRYVRNSGTDSPLGEAVELRPVEIEVWHDPDRPSAILLPLTSAASVTGRSRLSARAPASPRRGRRRRAGRTALPGWRRGR